MEVRLRLRSRFGRAVVPKPAAVAFSFGLFFFPPFALVSRKEPATMFFFRCVCDCALCAHMSQAAPRAFRLKRVKFLLRVGISFSYGRRPRVVCARRLFFCRTHRGHYWRGFIWERLFGDKWQQVANGQPNPIKASIGRFWEVLGPLACFEPGARTTNAPNEIIKRKTHKWP